MAEQALVGGNADLGAVYLTLASLAAQLPGQFANLGQRLGRNRFTETGETAGGVHWQAATEFGVAIADQLRVFTAGAELQVFVPVHFQRR